MNIEEGYRVQNDELRAIAKASKSLQKKMIPDE